MYNSYRLHGWIWGLNLKVPSLVAGWLAGWLANLLAKRAQYTTESKSLGSAENSVHPSVRPSVSFSLVSLWHHERVSSMFSGHFCLFNLN